MSDKPRSEGVRLRFLDWNRPVLKSAAQYLVGHYRSGNKLDMRNVDLVLPGGRAGRRLEELILDEVEKQGLDPDLFPPRVLTLGRFPELLYPLKMPLADDIVLQLSWLAAVDKMADDAPDILAPFMKRPPAAGDFEERMALGKILNSLHKELAAEALNFSDVAEKCRLLYLEDETPRWQTLALLQKFHLARLDSLGLWDVQTARIYAIKEKEPSTTDRDIVLIGVVDMNHAQKEILRLVSANVLALVFAPESLKDRFDEFGVLIPGKWTDSPIKIDDSQLLVSDKPSGEATEVMRILSGWNGRFPANRITVGVPNESIVPYLLQRMRQCGVKARYGPGQSLKSGTLCRFLETTADLVQYRTFSAFSDLMRLPDVQSLLAKKLPQLASLDLLTPLDKYRKTFLPLELDSPWRVLKGDGVQGKNEDFASLRAAKDAVLELLGELYSAGNERRSPAVWMKTISGITAELFGSSQAPGVCEAMRALETLLDRIADIPDSLTPLIGAGEALRLLLHHLESARLVPPQDSEAIEMLGWLELALDDADAMIITGMNEGVVPSSKSGDLFLPNTIRKELNIEDNDRRFARDAYALSLILASRTEKDRLRFIARKKTAEGDPLLPSRLFFMSDPDTTARRVRAFFKKIDADSPEPVFVGDLRPGTAVCDIIVPKPMPLGEPVNSLKVTEFKDYLACPYRYYLKHRLRLDVSKDDTWELDGAAFGNLAHEVLKRFGVGPIRDASVIDAIYDWLSRELDTVAGELYGKPDDALNPILAIQIEQLRYRLREFARWQANWTARGNRIRFTEFAPKESRLSFLEVDGVKMFLRGRIDRIDYNEQTNCWTIFDYKTSDSGTSPEKTHVKSGAWTDLQLPLYRHICRCSIPEMVSPRLGYIVLPKDVAKTGEMIADWDGTALAAADEAAREVVRAVREERFWPPAATPPAFTEIFAPICLDDQFKLV